MRLQKEIARMTIDIPIKSHRQLKTLSALLGKSIREIVTESIEDYLHSVKLPNKKTRKAIKDVENGVGLTKTKNVKDLFKKLGI